MKLAGQEEDEGGSRRRWRRRRRQRGLPLSPPYPPTAPAPFSPPRGTLPAAGPPLVPRRRGPGARPVGQRRRPPLPFLGRLRVGPPRGQPAAGAAARRAGAARRREGSRLPRVEEAERPPLDWFGLNFYGRVVLDWRLLPPATPASCMSDFGQGVWPAGLKAAVRRAGRELKRARLRHGDGGARTGRTRSEAEWADAYLGALWRRCCSRRRRRRRKRRGEGREREQEREEEAAVPPPSTSAASATGPSSTRSSGPLGTPGSPSSACLTWDHRERTRWREEARRPSAEKIAGVVWEAGRRRGAELAQEGAGVRGRSPPPRAKRPLGGGKRDGARAAAPLPLLSLLRRRRGGGGEGKREEERESGVFLFSFFSVQFFGERRRRRGRRRKKSLRSLSDLSIPFVNLFSFRIVFNLVFSC